MKVKSTLIEMKISLEGLKSTFELAEERTSRDLKTGQLTLSSLRNRKKKE